MKPDRKIGYLYTLMVLLIWIAIGYGCTLSASSLLDFCLTQVSHPAAVAKLTQFLSPSGTFLLKIAFVLGGVLLTTIIYFLYRYGQKLRKQAIRPYHYVKFQLSQFSLLERITIGLIFSLLIANQLYHLLNFPIHCDEAATYNWFVKRGIAVSLLYYPCANNHVLHSLICCFTSLLPLSITSALRLPALIYFIATFLLFTAFLRERYGNLSAILGVSFYNLFFLVNIYGFLSRGYGLLSFCCLCSVVAIFKWMERKDAFALAIYVVSGIMGMFTLLPYLYPLATLGGIGFFLLIFQKNYQDLGKWLLAHLAILMGTLICYLPILLANGTATFWQNLTLHAARLSSTQLFSMLPSHLGNIMLELTGNIIFTTVVLLIAMYWLFLFRKDKQRIWIFLGCLILPILAIFAQSTLLYPRLWIYFAFIWTGMLVEIRLPFKSIGHLLPILVLVLIGLLATFPRSLAEYHPYVTEAETVKSLLPKGSKVYVPPLSDLRLVLEYHNQTGFPIEVKPTHYPDLAALKTNAYQYDYLTLWDSPDSLSGFQLLYKGRYAQLYKVH